MNAKSTPAWLSAGCLATLVACSVPVSTSHSPHERLLPNPPPELALAVADPVAAPRSDPPGEHRPAEWTPLDQERSYSRRSRQDQEVRDRGYEEERYRGYGWRGSHPGPPKFYALASGAVGDYSIHDESLGEDERDAYMQRFRIGANGRRGTGAGLDMKWVVPEDDFYEGTINETDFNQFDLYAHFTVHPRTRDRLRVPIRVGPYFSRHAAEFNSTGDDTIYSSFGIRLEVEPEIVLIADEDSTMSVYGRFSGGLHSTYIDDDSTGRDYDSDGFTLGLEAGMRLGLGPLSLSGAYIYHESTIDESDVERGFVIPRFETEFSGFQFTLGFRF